MNKRSCFFSPHSDCLNTNNISQSTYLSQNNGPSSDQANTVVSYLAEYYVENYLQGNQHQQFNSNYCINRQHLDDNDDDLNFQSNNNIESDEEINNNSEKDDTLTPENFNSTTTSNFQINKTVSSSKNQASDSGYPSFNDVQKSVKYKSGQNTNFMKQLNEMQGFDANFTELKNYDENEENKKQSSSSNSENTTATYYEQMESPFGVTIQKRKNSNNQTDNNGNTTVTDEELNCGIM